MFWLQQWTLEEFSPLAPVQCPMLYDVGLPSARHPTALGNGLCPAGATPVWAPWWVEGARDEFLPTKYGFFNFNIFDDKAKKQGMKITTTGGLSSKQWTMTNHYQKSHRLLSTRL